MMLKVLLVGLCLGASALASPVQPEEVTIVEGPVCPVEDPYRKEEPFPINATVHPFIELGLNSTAMGVTAEGFSTLSWTLNLTTIFLTITFDIALEGAQLKAPYAADGYLDVRPLRPETLPSGNFSGAGLASLAVTNLHLKGDFVFLFNAVTMNLKLSTLNIDTLSFDSVSIDLGEGFLIGGKTPNWAELSANFQGNFNQDWAEGKEALTDMIKQLFNGFTHYTAYDLADLINEEVNCEGHL